MATNYPSGRVIDTIQKAFRKKTSRLQKSNREKEIDSSARVDSNSCITVDTVQLIPITDNCCGSPVQANRNFWLIRVKIISSN